MRVVLGSLLSLSLVAVGALAQADQPLTTNNSAQACVQFGDCTTLPAGNTAATATQQSPIRPPPTSAVIPPPTNAAQSSASLASLAAAGAASAYSSRVAGGQPTASDTPDGATSLAPFSVLVAPTTDATHGTATASADAAISIGSFSWAPAFAAGAMAVGVVFAL